MLQKTFSCESNQDKTSWNTLAYFAPDYIPEGTIFTWKKPADADNCTAGHGGEIWCRLTYTHDNGIRTEGWVSAHFLRSTTSEKSIDIRRWRREGRLRAGRQFSWSWTSGGEPSGTINVHTEADAVVLIYRVRSFLAEWKSIEQRVSITWTHCHLGGRRPWFTCSVHTNGKYCGRRVAMLYAAGELFACRRCCALAYASQQKDPLVRNVSRSAKIRTRLGGSPATYSAQFLSGRVACGAGPITVIARRWRVSKATCSPNQRTAAVRRCLSSLLSVATSEIRSGAGPGMGGSSGVPRSIPTS